ncbi:MAG: DNA sulfur modification protein DndB [Microbacterium gubbeenense]|uniref:DNA sulfur modification protein DndB n=1 Tax=Microbacterium gubbeenense TaxID=159896 RepID=UPI003F9CDB98
MVTTKQPKQATPTGYSTDEHYFATRYKQGARTVFAFQLTPAEITSLVKRPNPEANNPGNRRIRLSHAQGFAKYFLERDNWVAPGIILRAPSIFSFDENSELSLPGAAFGFVSFPRRNQADIHILDGQHRILGFFLAEELIARDLDKARDARATAKRVDGDKSAAYKQAEADISRLESVRDRFHTERVSIEIQVTDDMGMYRQMFYDIADNALGITASVKARFDTRKVVNRALPAVIDHPLLAGRTDLEVDRIRKSSPDYFTAKQVVEIIRVLIVGFDGRVSRRLEQELREGGVAQSATQFLDALVEVFPQLKAVQQGTLLPDSLRASSLLGSALFVRILAGAWFDLTTKHSFTIAMVKTFFEKLRPHLGAPVHENTIWKRELPAEIFNDGAYGPNGKRQASTALVATLVDWAIVTPEFLTKDPLPTPEARPEVNEDGDVAIDFSDLHDTKKLEVEERNAIEDIAAEATKKATKRTRAKSA